MTDLTCYTEMSGRLMAEISARAKILDNVICILENERSDLLMALERCVEYIGHIDATPEGVIALENGRNVIARIKGGK